MMRMIVLELLVTLPSPSLVPPGLVVPPGEQDQKFGKQRIGASVSDFELPEEFHLLSNP